MRRFPAIDGVAPDGDVQGGEGGDLTIGDIVGYLAHPDHRPARSIREALDGAEAEGSQIRTLREREVSEKFCNDYVSSTNLNATSA